MYMTYVETIRSITDKRFELKLVEQKINKLCAGPDDVKAVTYDANSVKLSKKSLSDVELYNELQRLVERKNTLQLQLSYDQQALKELDSYISKLLKSENNVEYEVFRLYSIKRIPLKQVSVMLGYSYGYIKNVASRVRKKIRACERTLDKKKERV